MMLLLLARTRTYHRDFMFFAITSVTARDENVRCFAENVRCFTENVPCFTENVLCFAENETSFYAKQAVVWALQMDKMWLLVKDGCK